MTDIQIIIPIHIFNENVNNMLSNALDSIKKNQSTYKYGKLRPLIIAPTDILKQINDVFDQTTYDSCANKTGNNDFCSQINLAVNNITTEHFSIIEFDDEYKTNWFKMAHDYYYTNESVSVFLPINVITDTEHKQFQYANEIAWTKSFSNELGFIDFDCLQDFSSFNLTGGIFNTNDFKTIGGLKSSIKASFGYEFLLRITKKELKVFVVPKEGYIHVVGREKSLSDECSKKMSVEEIKKWFDLAKAECIYTEDRKTNIDKIKAETMK